MVGYLHISTVADIAETTMKLQN